MIFPNNLQFRYLKHIIEQLRDDIWQIAVEKLDSSFDFIPLCFTAQKPITKIVKQYSTKKQLSDSVIVKVEQNFPSVFHKSNIIKNN